MSEMKDTFGKRPMPELSMKEKSSVEGLTVSAKAPRQESPLCVQSQSDWSRISKEENGRM